MEILSSSSSETVPQTDTGAKCTVFDGQIHPVQQARCPQQKDSASCGVFCCLFAEQICFSEKEIQPDDNADTLRYYVTLQLIKRSHIVDPELQRLFMAFIGT